MKRSSRMRMRIRAGARSIAASARGPLFALLAVYLYVGGCAGGKSGFVLALKAGKVAVTVAWCEVPRSGT